MEALGRRHDGPHDERVFPAAARAFRLQGLSQTHAGGAGQRHHRGILRTAQLDHRLAVNRRREDRKDLSRGRRIRHAAGVRLRLQAQARGVAELAAAVEPGSDAAAETSQAGAGKGRVAGTIVGWAKGALRAVPTIYTRRRHPEVLAVLHGEPRRMGHERLLPSFETPRKSARLLRMTAVYVERLRLVGTPPDAFASGRFA